MISNVINVQRINSQELVNHAEKDKKALNLAISNGNVEIVRLLAEKGMNLNIDKKTQRRLLRLAINNDRFEMLRLLLEKDAIDFEAFGNQVLMLAAKNSRLEIVEILLEKGVDIVGRDEDGFTALHLAVFYEHVEMVKYLIGKISNINVGAESDRTPLNIAAENGYVEIAGILIDKGADINFSVIESAIRFGQVKIVRFLLDKGAYVNIKNQNGFSPLHVAVENENLEMVRILADNGAYLNVRNDKEFSALQMAVFYEYIEIIKYLIKKNARINIENSAICLAAKKGILEILKIFVAKAKEDQEEEIIYDESVLYSAAESGKIEIVDFFIALETDINRRNNHIKTLLERAVCIGKLAIVKFLIEIKGADKDSGYNGYNGEENSLLQLAVKSEHLKIVNYLIGLGVDIFANNQDGKAMLISALMSENIGIIKVFLVKEIERIGDNVNELLQKTVDSGIYCAMHYLVGFNNSGFDIIEREYNRIDFVRLIVDKAPTYINFIDKSGYSVLKLAIENNDEQLLRFLVEKGADIYLEDKYGRSLIENVLKSDKSEMIQFLIDNKYTDVNWKNSNGDYLLHIAARNSKLEIVQFLVGKGVDIYLENLYRESPFHVAVTCGKLEIVQFLIDNKQVDVNLKQSSGYSLLHLAVFHENSDVTRYLVEKGVDVNVKNNCGISPLHFAAENDDLEIVRFLIDKGADINAKDYYEYSPLHSAAKYGSLEIVRFLVDKEADIDAKNHNGYSPLHLSARNDDFKVVEFLVNKGADLKATSSYKKESVLNLASDNENLQVLKYLLDNDVYNYQEYGNSILHYAVFKGKFKTVQFLLEEYSRFYLERKTYGIALQAAVENKNYELIDLIKRLFADLNCKICCYYKRTALHIAAKKGDIILFKYLLDRGADLCASDRFASTILHSAVTASNFQIVKYLVVEKNANPNLKDNFGRSSFDLALFSGHFDIVRLFLLTGKNSSDINLSDDYIISSGFYWAVEMRDLEMVKFLVERGVDVNLKHSGYSMLHLAAEKGYLDIVKYLVEKGANVNAETTSGLTVLHSGVISGRFKIVRLLVKSGADVNARNVTKQRTVLQLAAIFGNVKIIKFLVYKGADINAKDKNGKSAIRLAYEHGNSEIVKYLADIGTYEYTVNPVYLILLFILYWILFLFEWYF